MAIETGAATELGEGVLEALGAGLRGGVIRQGDEQFDDARAIYNGMIDKRPAVITRCVDTGDVIAAVNFGRQTGLEVAVRGGWPGSRGSTTRTTSST